MNDKVGAPMPLKHGESIGDQLMPLLKTIEAEMCKDDKQRAQWWGGLMSNLAGQMRASVGVDAARVLGEAIIHVLNISESQIQQMDRDRRRAKTGIKAVDTEAGQ
jgi:hypothetical protein